MVSRTEHVQQEAKSDRDKFTFNYLLVFVYFGITFLFVIIDIIVRADALHIILFILYFIGLIFGTFKFYTTRKYIYEESTKKHARIFDETYGKDENQKEEIITLEDEQK